MARVDLKKRILMVFQSLPDNLKKYPIFIAVSGGVDSTVLADVALNLRDSLPPLHFIHLNYRFRIPDSDQEEGSLREWARKEKILFFSKRFSSKLKPKNLQAWAREKRFQFFQQTIQKKFQGKGIVWLAHHQQDQAETVFHRLLRGAGLDGLGGMETLELIKDLHGKQFSNPLMLFRPLLEAPHEAILHYAKAHRLPYHQDRSNLTDQYLRNRIRRIFFPLLLQENPQSLVGMVRLGRLARGAKRGLDWVAEEYLAQGKNYGKSKNTLKRKSLLRFPSSLAVIILEKWLRARLASPQSYLPLLARLEEVLNAPSKGDFQIPLKGNDILRISAENFSILRKRKKKSGLRKSKILC
jgi:tRNA(Ile)-lysidine synthetase-like protein